MELTQVVYLDVLFLINFSVNYILLHITERILSLNTKTIKKILAASFGGIYSCFIFFPELSGLYTFYSKVIFSLIITGQAFGIKKIRLFIKTVAVFYISSFLMCGVTFALLFVTKSMSNEMCMTNNGVFYFNIQWKILLLGAGLCIIMTKIIKAVIYSVKGTIYKEVKINFEGKSVTLSGIIDTGNRLTDYTDSRGVIVCEMSALEGILSDDMIEFLSSNTDDLSDRLLDGLHKIRFIPYSSIGKSSGMLRGFLSDSIEVDNKKYKKITVAVYSGHLSEDSAYKVLLGTGFL